MTYKETVLADSPAGYWRLGETSGTAAADSSGNNRTATYANVTLGAAGLIASDSNTAATFNGTSSEVWRADEALFDLPGTFTLEAWIKPTKVGVAQSILSKTEGEAWGLELTAANKILFYFRTETGEFPEVVGGTVAANSIYHVVVTKSATTMMLWVNGAKVTELATTKVPRNQAGAFRIGKFSNEVPQPFTGVIDEVAIYESVLSEARIKAHYVAGTSSPPVISSASVSNVTETEATFKVSYPSGSPTAYVEYGATVAYGTKVELTKSKEGFFATGKVTGLTGAQTYHWRGVLVGEGGTTNGEDQTFTTQGKPTVTEETTTGITTEGATLHAVVNFNGVGSAVGGGKCLFEWGLTTGYGSSAEFEGGSGTTPESFSKAVTGLTSGATYHWRVTATNKLGTTHGEDKTFTIELSIPTNTVAPKVTGTPKVGETLSTTTGTWTETPTSYTYQWERSPNGSTEVEGVSGAHSSAYTLTSADKDEYLRCSVRATNSAGTSAAKASNFVGPVEESAAEEEAKEKEAEEKEQKEREAKEQEERERLRKGHRRRKPPLDLDVEVETTAGTFRLASDDPKASNRPSNMSFTTLRGNGFSNGSLQLNRQIFRDYPDVNLLDTWRMIGRQGEVAYEGRLHSDPRTNSPSQTLNVELVGWMSYLTSRKISPLIIDRTLDGWTGPSSGRRASLITSGYRYEAEPEVGWHGEGAPGPGIIFTFSTFGSSYYELGEAWKRAGGEAIGALRFDFQSLAGGADANWSTVGYLCDNDLAESFVSGTNLHKTTTAGNEVVSDGEAVYQYALLAESYTGTFTGTTNEVHGFFNPRIVGTHGLTAGGESPNEGYYVSDIIKYVLNTYYPKINTEHVKENQFAVQQATWAESPVYGSELIAQLNDLTLWEENIWENRSYHYEPADFTKTDWQIRTDEPGVEVTFQGESIENFANGVVVTYTDFSGIRHVLYPDQHPELRDTSLNNAATEHGEDLWTDVEVRWPATEPEALQYGRAYLAEHNRPKRPGTFTIKSGYIKDGAGHWQPGWRVRNSATLSVMDHPSESAPRLITATSWDDNSKSLSITVDAPPSTFDAVVARTVLALSARNVG